MDINEKTALVQAAVEEIFPDMQRVGRFVYDHAELGNAELESSRFLAEELEKLGFAVQYPYAGVATALRADLHCGEGPTVAFLAEYDALPGYGPNHDQVAHACGHNWIAATCYGTCAALQKLRDQFSGTISFIGAPAEESTGGKIDVLRNGGYADVDAAMQFHLGNYTVLSSEHLTFLAMDSLEFTFHGKAAHAAGQPHRGINALDAVNLTFAGINCLRQHVTPDVRMHGIITDGGLACNVVPDFARCRFYIRAARRSYLNEVKERVLNIARGASLMTGAELEWRYFENPFDELTMNQNVQTALRENLRVLGVEETVPDTADGGFGSSDVGNVSQVAATAYCELATGLGPEISAHMESFLQGVVGPYADKTMPIAAAAMAMTALDIFADPGMVK
ncbi:MAG: M20 family metallopeptidase [Oscillospiraceae bacterium]|nr:M20 family metallopeptidase [Oscillospiraceae bacterium]